MQCTKLKLEVSVPGLTLAIFEVLVLRALWLDFNIFFKLWKVSNFCIKMYDLDFPKSTSDLSKIETTPSFEPATSRYPFSGIGPISFIFELLKSLELFPSWATLHPAQGVHCSHACHNTIMSYFENDQEAVVYDQITCRSTCSTHRAL